MLMYTAKHDIEQIMADTCHCPYPALSIIACGVNAHIAQVSYVYVASSAEAFNLPWVSSFLLRSNHDLIQ